MVRGATYASVNIVSLSLFEQLSSLFSMDHTAIHGYCLSHDVLDEIVFSGMAHGIDPTLGEGEVDGFGEIEGDRRGMAKVCLSG